MTRIPAKLRRGATAILALALGGCVDSAAPLLTGTQPLLGPRLRVHVYTLSDGGASGPDVGTFRWDGAQYAVVGRPTFDIAAFTVAPYRDEDLMVQARSSRRQVKGIEYAVAHKQAAGVYLLAGLDEADADQATRAKFCTKAASSSCRIADRDALMAFAAAAARADRKGALAIIVGEHGR
ncbi:MAG TPA: hypothetical protein VLX44_03055 [Xanthobacteraceae bacterium]|nr:hypothetical protein [Xanthobacteraceae bacterium]